MLIMGLSFSIFPQEFLRFLVSYHRFISFSMYVAGFVGFVFSLVKKHYLKQFTLVRNWNTWGKLSVQQTNNLLFLAYQIWKIKWALLTSILCCFFICLHCFQIANFFSYFFTTCNKTDYCEIHVHVVRIKNFLFLNHQVKKIESRCANWKVCFSRTTGLFSTKLCSKHPLVEGDSSFFKWRTMLFLA